MARRYDDDDDDDDDDDRPIRKRPEGGGGGSTTLILLLVGGGVLGLCVCCGGAGLLVALAPKPEKQVDAKAPEANIPEANAPDAKKKDRKKLVANPDFKLVAKGKVVLNKVAKLTNNDPLDPRAPLEANARMKAFPVQLQAGKTYVITMDSQDFDTYLRLESPTGENLAEDDDSGGDLNARIDFRPGQAGMFRVIATSFDGGVGQFRLKVQEAD